MKAEGSSHTKKFLSSFSFPHFLTSWKLQDQRSAQSKDEPGKFPAEDQASFFMMGWQSWGERISSNLQFPASPGGESTGFWPRPSLFQTSISLTLTYQWQKAAECQKRAPKTDVYQCSGKGAQCLHTEEGHWDEAALQKKRKALQEPQKSEKMYIVLYKIRFCKWNNALTLNAQPFIFCKRAQYVLYCYYFYLHLSAGFFTLQGKQNSCISEVRERECLALFRTGQYQKNL